MNTTIEKIRAEVERRKKGNQKDESEHGEGAFYEDVAILSFLSDLEKSEKPINPTIEKLRALIKMQIRREELNFASLGGGGQTMNIGALEWVLKQLDTLQEQPVMIKWTGNNLKEVIEFTGKNSRFDEWFKTWDEYESYVHSHGDVLKLFNEDGTHLEVPVGAWIVKTPDGRNVPSIFLYKEQPVKTDIVEDLKHYLATTPKEQIKKDWESLKEWGKVGPSVSEFLGWEHPVCEGLEEEIERMVKCEEEFMNFQCRSQLIGYMARHFAKWGAEHLDK